MPSSQADNAALPTKPKLSGWLTIVAAMLAGIAGALVTEQVGNVFKMSPDFDNIPLTPSPEYMARYNAAMSSINRGIMRSILRSSVPAAVLGLAIGVVSNWPESRPSADRILDWWSDRWCGGWLAAGHRGFLLCPD